MNETKAIRIASVKHAGGFTLRLRWVNRSVTLVDLSEPVHRLKGLQPLLDAKVFAKAKKGEGGHSVVWPAELDMGADRHAVPRTVLLACKGWEAERKAA
jgi:hypothetical protein